MDSYFTGSSSQYFGYSAQDQRYQNQPSRSFSPVSRYPGSSSSAYDPQSSSLNNRNLSPAFDRTNGLVFPTTSSINLDQIHSANVFNFPLRSSNINNRSSPSHKPNNNSSNTTYLPGSDNFNGRSYSSNQQHSLHSRHSQPPVYSYATGNFTSFRQSSPNNNTHNKNRNGRNTSPNSSVSNSKKKMNSVTMSKSEDMDPQRPCRILKRGDELPPSLTNSGSGNSNTTAVENRNNNVALGSFSSQGDNACNSVHSTNKENTTNGNTSGEEDKDRNNGSQKSDPTKTALSCVSDVARFHGLNIEYRLVKETGPPHAPIFTVVLTLGSEQYEGQGSSIKRAQTAAANEALEKTTLSRPPPRSKNSFRRPFAPKDPRRSNWSLTKLQALAEELNEPIAFMQQPVSILDPFRKGEPPSRVSVSVGDRIFTGEGNTFTAAKNMATMIALKAMMSVKQEKEMAKMAEEANKNEDVDLQNKSPISIIHEMAMKRGMKVIFEVMEESGPPHKKTFIISCTVNEHQTTGEGNTKQAAKKAASEAMIAKLKESSALEPVQTHGTASPNSFRNLQKSLMMKPKTARKKNATPVVKDLEKPQVISPISRLIQVAHIKKYKEPEFKMVSVSGNEKSDPTKGMSERDRRNYRRKNKPVFTLEVTVGPHTCTGSGPNKKAAKKEAAEAALLAMGYGPTEQTETRSQSCDQNGDQKNEKGDSTGNDLISDDPGPGLAIKSARAIAPGLFAVTKESFAEVDKAAANRDQTNGTDGSKEVKTDGTNSTKCVKEGIEKLSYLARLFEVSVSYSDFPKNNEFLSVVSLATTPPYVAHGIGPSLEEAQNSAALKVLEELSNKGLDSVQKSSVE